MAEQGAAATDGLQHGLLVVDASFNLIAANREAVKVLTYPNRQHALRRFLKRKLSSYFEDAAPEVRQFRSGNRTYRIWPFPLDALQVKGCGKGMFTLVLERISSSSFSTTEALMEAASLFGLSAREQETAKLLLIGLRDREIAERMKISHHTVRTFVRLLMIKMDVSTRSEVLLKILATSPKGATTAA